MPEARFLVGESEKHEIGVRGSFWSGKVTVDVDGRRVIETRNMGISKPIDFSIGEKEKHEVLIKVSSTQSFEIYVDGRFIGTSSTLPQQSYITPSATNPPSIPTTQVVEYTPRPQTRTIIIGYIFALLGGIIGIAIGYGLQREQNLNDKKHGKRILVLAVVMTIVWAGSFAAGFL